MAGIKITTAADTAASLPGVKSWDEGLTDFQRAQLRAHEAGGITMPDGTSSMAPYAATKPGSTTYDQYGGAATANSPATNGMSPTGEQAAPASQTQNQTNIKPTGDLSNVGATPEGGYSLQELAANANITPTSSTPKPGDGGTAFNPGGGTNPNGTNPTVPQGNPNNGTAPSVYQLLDQLPDAYTTGDPQMDQLATAVAEGVMGGEIPWNDLTAAQRSKVLAGIDRALATDPNLWTKWGNSDEANFIRQQFINQYGDPTQGARGAADNTVNPDGSVQGQYQPDQGQAFQAVSSDAAANDRAVGDNELSSNRLNDILSQDSPLMTLARQDGVDMANRAGLRNSSLAAGASMREMTRQATPLAMQEADVFNRTGMQNQQLESARRDANASRQTQTSVTNAGMANDMLNADRQRELQYNLQQLAGDQDYAKQQLAGQLAADIANIEGQYKQIISQNDTAARMFDSYYDTVAEVLSNSEFGQPEAQGRITRARQEFEAGMQMILGFEEFDLNAPSAGSFGNEVPPIGTPEYEQYMQDLMLRFRQQNIGAV